MEQFSDNQRYTLEKAQREAEELKTIVLLGWAATYIEAESYLADLHEWNGTIVQEESIANEQDEDYLRYEQACDDRDGDIYCPISPTDYREQLINYWCEGRL